MFKSLSSVFKWLPVGKVPEISASELKQCLEDGNIQVLDVRTEPEWRSGHIKGSINIPVHQLTSRAGELAFSRDKPVAVICLSAHRSIPAVRHLLSLGYKDVRQLQGGIKAWNRHYRQLLVKATG